MNFKPEGLEVIKLFNEGKDKKEIVEITGKSIQFVNGTISRYKQFQKEENEKKLESDNTKTLSDVVEVKEEFPEKKKFMSENLQDGIEVLETKEVKIHKMNYEELFSGFDTFYGITYSSSPDYIYEIIKNYEYAEIIFGTQHTLNTEMCNVFAVQMGLVETLKVNTRFEYFKERVKNGTLKLFVPKNTISHEKLYLLEDTKTNSKRSIYGSANLSKRAFNGLQREIIEFNDTTDAFRYFKGIYENLKLECSNEINFEIIDANESNIKTAPIAAVIKEKEYVYLDKVSEDEAKEIEITQKISEIDEELRADVSELLNKKSDIPKITYDKLDKVSRKIQFEQNEDKQKTKELPNFEFNLEDNSFKLNSLDFNDYLKESFPMASVKNDILVVDKFVKGLKDFNGDTNHTIEIFNMLLTYSFVSPFLTTAKRSYNKNGNGSLTQTNKCPEFFVIYGDAAAGKSCMVSFVQRLMFGQNFINSEAKEFTPTKIREIRKLSKGVPVVINDLDSKRWTNYSDEIIKEDTFELSKTCKLKNGKIIKTNPPACIITANKINTMKPEITARAVIAHVTASIDAIDRIKKQTVVDKLASEITPAFYIAFLNIFIPLYKEALVRFEDGKDVDFFELASKCIRKVAQEQLGFVPSWMKELNIEKLFGRENVNYNGIKKLKEFYCTNAENCIISRKNNKIIFDLDNQYDAKAIKQELPASMLASVSGKKLICNLEETSKILNIDVRKHGLFNTKNIADFLVKNNIFKNINSTKRTAK